MLLITFGMIKHKLLDDWLKPITLPRAHWDNLNNIIMAVHGYYASSPCRYLSAYDSLSADQDYESNG